jgi:tetratricopeptide (TPR) repeat protein
MTQVKPAGGTWSTVPPKRPDALQLESSGAFPAMADLPAAGAEHAAGLRALQAETEFARGRFSDAALSYFAITLFDPDNADAHCDLGICLERCGRWDAASEVFARALAIDAGMVEARLGLAACLLHLHRPEDALLHFTECGSAWEAGPALLGKAVALQLLQRNEEAAGAYEVLLAADPNSEELLANVIGLSIETRDLERVWNLSLRLLQVCPRSTVALQGLATVAFECSDHQAAAAYCDRILELAPNCLEAWHNFRIAIETRPFRSSEEGLVLHRGGKQ